MRSASPSPLLILPLLASLLVAFHHDVYAAVPVEQATLLGLKKAWTVPYKDLDSWVAGADCSKWAGVTCDSKGNVIKLVVEDRYISGSIPASIGDLKKLQTLDLSYNRFTGPLPSSIGNLKDLTYLSFAEDKLSGPIPSSLGNLTNLQTLLLSFNSFSGPIPASLGGLKKLTTFEAYGIGITGSIPSFLKDFKNLKRLVLGSNNFSGPIPSFLGDLKNLEYLDFTYNFLSGAIPSSVTNLLKKLKVTAASVFAKNCLKGVADQKPASQCK